MGFALKKKKAKKIIGLLSKEYSGKGTALRFKSNFQLLVAVILSAQCTDSRVNLVTKKLFADFPDANSINSLSPKELEKYIYSSGFYRAKAKNIKGSAKKIVEEFSGKVPSTMNELLSLPGVARKTANVVLGAGFGKVEGIVVDTHVKRLSNRLGFTQSQNPELIEKELMQLIPQEEWWNISNYLIWHGRAVCTARNPNCAKCSLNMICPAAFALK
ncbi:MAG: endonuclease III [Candidatus Diapherotrites archaeon CG11_big_fil_rev_8_21_14_0_20_37_9]|nr:MAG: endonuclease III [Candidatus Diapherotrites archaeon CG11_big_fil_rev_8_21_14_0_20_37_9]